MALGVHRSCSLRGLPSSSFPGHISPNPGPCYHPRRPSAPSRRPRAPLCAQGGLSGFIEALTAAVAAGEPMVPLAVGAAAAAAAYAAWLLVRFIRADADLTLLSKRQPPPGAFHGKVVWIVGASQGLGEALAAYWAEQGARLVLSSRSLDKLQAVKERCCAHVPEDHVELLPLDLVGPPEALEEVARKAFQAFEGAGVDYLVHNAGASQHAAAEDAIAGAAAALLALNLQGPLALARATLPLMLAQGRGQQVVVASMAAVVPSPGQAVYAAAKSGLRGYFASVAAEMADRGLGVTVCCPGPLNSGMDGKPRLVYGAEGLIQQANTGLSKKRVSTQRAAELIARAAWHRLDECWIAFHPVLLMGYLMQYAPWAGMQLLKKVGASRARAMREGRSGYDVGSLLRAKGSNPASGNAAPAAAADAS